MSQIFNRLKKFFFSFYIHVKWKQKREEKEEDSKEIRQVTQFQFYIRRTLRWERAQTTERTDTIGKKWPIPEQVETHANNNMMQWKQSECFNRMGKLFIYIHNKYKYILHIT